MKVLLICILGIAFIGCSTLTNEGEAKKLIKNHLFETLHDFKSYESIKFGKLDSAFSRANQQPEYIRGKAVFDSLNTAADEYLSTAKIYAGLSFVTNKAARAAKEATKVVSLMDSLAKVQTALLYSFKPQFIGWKMEHSFRANNLSGNMSIHHEIFYFDKKLAVVLDTDDIGEADNHDVKD
jgi:hypothetical protein